MKIHIYEVVPAGQEPREYARGGGFAKSCDALRVATALLGESLSPNAAMVYAPSSLIDLPLVLAHVTALRRGDFFMKAGRPSAMYCRFQCDDDDCPFEASD